MSEKLKTISNEIIQRYTPWYDPSECGIPDGEELPIKEWVEKYRKVLQSECDIIWLLCRDQYMSEKDMRLFAVWCARETLKLVENPDQRSIEACNVAERYARGEATDAELKLAELAAMEARTAALEAAWAAASSAAWAAAWEATGKATGKAVLAEAREAAFSKAITAQVNHLLTYFEK